MSLKSAATLALGLTVLSLAVAVAPCPANGRFPDDEGFLSLFNRSRPDATPPFELPDTLPGGGVKQFHRAASTSAFDYSLGGRVFVFRYEEAEVAAEDFAVFAKSNEAVDDKSAPALTQQGACVARQKDAVTLWFLLDDFIVGFQLPTEQWSLPAVAKTADELIKTETERTAKTFGTPERAVQTFVKAVEKADESQIMRCLTARGDAATRRQLTLMKSYLPMLRFMLMEQMGRAGRAGGDGELGLPRPRIGPPEKTADGHVLVPVRLDENMRGEQVWFEMLKFASGLEKAGMRGGLPAGQIEPLWIPVVQVRNRWAIDLPTLGRSAFSKTVPPKEDGDCFANLRQIVLALKAAANDDVATQKFPERLSTLVNMQYVSDVKMFSAPGVANKIQRAEDVDEKSDYDYAAAGQQDTGDGDLMVIFDKPAVHDGKGRHVGFADGHIQWIDEEEFKKRTEDGPQRAEMLAKARATLNDARQLDAAIDQWALETGKTANEAVDLKGISVYLRDGALKKMLSDGKAPNDRFGNPIVIGPVGPQQISISPETKKALEKWEFDWSNY